MPISGKNHDDKKQEFNLSHSSDMSYNIKWCENSGSAVIASETFLTADSIGHD
jgi:hypothetical protein